MSSTIEAQLQGRAVGQSGLSITSMMDKRGNLLPFLSLSLLYRSPVGKALFVSHPPLRVSGPNNLFRRASCSVFRASGKQNKNGLCRRWRCCCCCCCCRRRCRRIRAGERNKTRPSQSPVDDEQERHLVRTEIEPAGHGGKTAVVGRESGVRRQYIQIYVPWANRTATASNKIGGGRTRAIHTVQYLPIVLMWAAFPSFSAAGRLAAVIHSSTLGFVCDDDRPLECLLCLAGVSPPDIVDHGGTAPTALSTTPHRPRRDGDLSRHGRTAAWHSFVDTRP
jgi:hypothetical protein